MSTKFKAGNRFTVKENGLGGVVKATSFNSIYQENEYHVTWDSEPGQVFGYPADECDPIWELECPVVALINKSYPGLTTPLPSGVDGSTIGLPISIDYSPIDFVGIPNSECLHEFVEYHGFNESYSPIDFVGIPNSECLHEFVEYHGFNESYSYCKKCDEKKRHGN